MFDLWSILLCLTVFILLITEQGTLTIVRRSSGKGKGGGGGSVDSSTPTDNPEAYLRGQSVDLEEILDNVDLETDSLPAVDTPDACDKAALRLVDKTTATASKRNKINKLMKHAYTKKITKSL